MNHRPFPKIPTTLQDTSSGSPNWVATEKIHGAQLVVATDGKTVRIGKRKAWLAAGDAFFGWQMIRRELEDKVAQMFNSLGRGGELHVYGELFGGEYPHPRVTALPGLTAVQSGIWYSPKLEWAAFDALVIDPDRSVFLAYQQLEDLALAVDLRLPPCLLRGSRSELSRLPLRYQSQVPQMLGLPDIPGNTAEGFVQKPDRELEAGERPIVKHKIPEFDDKRFDASRPFNANALLSIDELTTLAVPMMGPMRVASARSKVGEDPTAVQEEMVLDLWIDLEEMFPRRMTALVGSESDQLRIELEGLAHAALGSL